MCEQLLQEDLELEQVRVNSLTHMVVVVDENSGDSATAALEGKLQVRTNTLTHTYTHTYTYINTYKYTHTHTHTHLVTSWFSPLGRLVG